MLPRIRIAQRTHARRRGRLRTRDRARRPPRRARPALPPGTRGRRQRRALVLERERALESLSAKELAGFSPLLGQAARARLTLDSALDRRRLTGGTARSNVERRLATLEAARLRPRPARRQGRRTTPRKGRDERRGPGTRRTRGSPATQPATPAAAGSGRHARPSYVIPTDARSGQRRRARRTGVKVSWRRPRDYVDGAAARRPGRLPSAAAPASPSRLRRR